MNVYYPGVGFNAFNNAKTALLAMVLLLTAEKSIPNPSTLPMNIYINTPT